MSQRYLRLRKRVVRALREVAERDGRKLLGADPHAAIDEDLVTAILEARLPGESIQTTIIRMADAYLARPRRFVVSEKCRARACSAGLGCLCERLHGCTIGPLAERLAPAPPLHGGCECTQEAAS